MSVTARQSASQLVATSRQPFIPLVCMSKINAQAGHNECFKLPGNLQGEGDGNSGHTVCRRNEKGHITIMHYFMPKRGILSLHSGCNVGQDQDVTLFFGLSGGNPLSELPFSPPGKEALNRRRQHYLIVVHQSSHLHPDTFWWTQTTAWGGSHEETRNRQRQS